MGQIEQTQIEWDLVVLENLSDFFATIKSLNHYSPSDEDVREVAPRLEILEQIEDMSLY